jgi:hypothetical protein
MSTAGNQNRTNVLRDVPPAVWVAAALLLVAFSVLVHAVFPRYQFEAIDQGRAIVIYDRWTGQFQRANYDAQGEPTLTRMLRPF